MNKAVMISIQPKWCELIASGKKTIEVRRTAPKIETPFKCYIYCTLSGSNEMTKDLKKWYREKWYDKKGKVIGEFVCDRIETIACHKYNNGVGFDYSYYTDSEDTLTDKTQLTNYDIQQYLGRAEDGECVGYAWHISDLKIYDKPKALREFRKPPCEKSEKYCENCKYKHHDHNGEIYCKDDSRAIIRLPQSWCYVEPLEA